MLKPPSFALQVKAEGQQDLGRRSSGPLLPQRPGSGGGPSGLPSPMQQVRPSELLTHVP
jgi:hypothetical protein